MKALVISILIFFSFGVSNLFAQLTFEGGENSNTIMVNYSGNSIPMFAVKASAEGVSDGKVILTLEDAASWSVTGEQVEGSMPGVAAWTVDSEDAVAMTNLGDGIYKVTATKGGTTNEWYFAIVNQYVKNFNLSVENPDACDCINIQINNLTLSKPDFFKNIVFSNVNNFELLRSGETIANPTSETALTSIQDCDISSQEVDYQVKLTDAYGFMWLSDIINFQSKVPKAMFSADPSEGEAPLEVDFINQSQNADNYSWYLYKDFSTLEGVTAVQDSLWVPIDNNEELSYKYMHPGKYVVKIIATNTTGVNQCKSEYVIDGGKRIVVDSSLVQVPNVFTPNGDGHNDIFRVKARSLKSFHAVVFNRLGRKVHEWEDPNEGWDGKIGGSYATPGTYFYVVEAVGTEQDAKKYVKKGTVLLIREK